MDLCNLIEEYLDEWKECKGCNYVIRSDKIKYITPDIVCNKCYENNKA